jgi:hypothetical protein
MATTTITRRLMVRKNCPLNIVVVNVTGVQPPPFVVYANFDALMGGLRYEIQDTNGNVLQRLEKFFPVPPVPSCG